MGLSGVERNLDTPAQFAGADIVHAGESPVKEAISQVNIVDKSQQASNTDQSVDFGAIVDAGNLDFIVPIDLAGSVIQLFHNLVSFSGNRPGALGLLT